MAEALSFLLDRSRRNAVFKCLQGDRVAESSSHQPFLNVWTCGSCEEAPDGPSSPFILLLYAGRRFFRRIGPVPPCGSLDPSMVVTRSVPMER